MGKYRKIEIDDRMPCNKNEVPIIPKCVVLEELWPAILTKAIIKLFSYKYKLNDYLYETIGDISIINVLTGYIGEKMDSKDLNMGN